MLYQLHFYFVIWRLGQRLTSGTTHGLELVNEFRQQTHCLATYVSLLASETDDNLVRIKKELAKFEIIFNKIAQLDEDLKKGFSRIDEVSNTVLNILKIALWSIHSLKLWTQDERFVFKRLISDAHCKTKPLNTKNQNRNSIKLKSTDETKLGPLLHCSFCGFGSF